jgi:hypothetical protein
VLVSEREEEDEEEVDFDMLDLDEELVLEPEEGTRMAT